MTLGQRVAVMRDGRILQVDRPQKLYEAPQDLFVAAFIGSPAMNLVEAKIDGDHVLFGQVPAAARSRAASGYRGQGHRARHQARELRGCRLRTGRAAHDRRLGRRPRRARRRPRVLRVDAPRITAEMLEAQDEATLLAEPSALFSARVDPKSRARVGEQLELTVDPRRSTSSTANPVKRCRRGHRANGLDHRGGTRMTKQSETRERVLDLIERLGVGEAIPPSAS